MSTSMGCFFSKPKTVPSVPTAEKPLQSTSIPGTTSTPPSRSGTAASAREQPKGAALSQSHDDGRDYAPSSGCGYSSRNIQTTRKCVRGPTICPVEQVLCSGPDPCRWMRQLCRTHHRIRLFEGIPPNPWALRRRPKRITRRLNPRKMVRIRSHPLSHHPLPETKSMRAPPFKTTMEPPRRPRHRRLNLARQRHRVRCLTIGNPRNATVMVQNMYNPSVMYLLPTIHVARKRFRACLRLAE